MRATRDPQHELQRKVRTLLRGITTLWFKRQLLNPFRYGTFAFFLISHKLLRWLVPLFMLTAFVANLLLISNSFYFIIFLLQILFYLAAIGAWFKVAGLENKIFGKIPMFFCSANFAIVLAWKQYFQGKRQEIWDPTKRSNT